MSLHYHANGSGRDLYIHLNNGGFSVPHMGSIFPKPGSFRKIEMKTGPQARMKYVPTEAMPYNYHQDGTGRDGYILGSNVGGFVSP